MRILLPKVPNCGTRRKYWKNFGQNTEKIFTVLSLMAHAEPRGGVVSLIQ